MKKLILTSCFACRNIVKAGIFLLVISSVSEKSFSQNTKTDSLKAELKTAKADTTKVKILNELSWELKSNNPAQALKYAGRALSLSKKLSSSFNKAIAKSGKKGIANSYNNIGIVHDIQGNYEKAIMYYQKYLKICEELGDKKGMGSSFGNIGIVHQNQGNYEKAIMYYQKSLKIKEELRDRKGMSTSYNNIGAIHQYQGNYPKALEYYQKSLKIREELGDRKGMSGSYNNIGSIHNVQGNYPRAWEYLQKSLKIDEELGDRMGMSTCYINIGNIHYYQGNYPKALEYYQKSLKIKEELGEREGIAMTIGNIAGLNIKLKNYTKAIEHANKGLNIAKEIGALYIERGTYKLLFTAYEGLNNTDKALKYYKLYTEAKDSLFNEEKNKQITEMETRYQSEKKEQQIKLLNKDKKLQKTQLDKQKLIIWSGAGGLLLVLTLAFFIYRGYRHKKRANVLLAQQNAEINQQKEEITFQRDEIEKNRDEIALKNKDITDSINYAVRIQQAILPTEDFTNEILGEHFILFKPKDIVSGDFYWAAKIKNWLIVAAVDCTGHGVPGAFMSMLGVSFLNEIVRKEEITQPNQVLNELREYVISSLQQSSDRDDIAPSLPRREERPYWGDVIPRMPANHTQNLSGFGEPDSVSNKSSKPSAQQDESSDKVKDGMDMALIVIDTETNKLQFAGANNPLYLINPNRKEWPKEVLPFGEDLGGAEIKADKMPIGIHEEMKEFTNNELQLQKGDTLYIFSDGYPDQFGGEKGKKLKYKPFKKLFLNIQDKSMKEQKAVLDKTFEDWKGDLEQLDDVVVIGIRV